MPVKNKVSAEENIANANNKIETVPKSLEVLPAVITSDNINNPQMVDYINYLRHQIIKNWNMSSIYGNGYVVAEVSFDKEGNMLTSKFVEGSRNQSLDQSVWNAIISTKNLATPPDVYDSQKIRLKFEYNNGHYSIY